MVHTVKFSVHVYKNLITCSDNCAVQFMASVKIDELKFTVRIDILKSLVEERDPCSVDIIVFDRST